MLHNRPGDGWHARKRAEMINPTMIFEPDGLVLGVGTILLETDGSGRLKSLRGQEMRLLALLSAFHDGPAAPWVLSNVERAVKAWSEGDACLAYIHLAHARLHPPQDLRSGAYRLEMADCAIRRGASPRAVFKALSLDAQYIDALEKTYNAEEPRVSAGSGKTSGEWTSGGGRAGGNAATGDGAAGAAAQGSSLAGAVALPASSFLGDLDAGQVAELGAYALRLLGPGPVGAAAAVFGLLFIPSSNKLNVTGDVPGVPGLSYSWNRDETAVQLRYESGGEAPRTFALTVDGDVIRDEQGKVVGRVIGGDRIAIDTLAVIPDLVKEDEPRLCPAPAPDVAGSDQGKPDEENRSRQYENFIKLLINPSPSAPTPSGFAYYLPNPAKGGKPVSFDDCQKTTGIVIEIKGEGLAKLTDDLPGVMEDKFIDQATRQMAASGERPIIWVFAEEKAALFARRVFDANGLQKITVAYVPWTRSDRQ